MVTRILTEEDNGRDIKVTVGEIIRVDLRFHGSAGYSWHPHMPDNSSMKLIGSRSVDLSEEGMTGGPAIGMWYFKTIAPGNTSITLLHYRAWEGSTKASKKYEVKLLIISK